jgi:hypothetical protein
MKQARDIIKARDCGQVRYSFVTDSSNDLSAVLAKFGLFDDSSLVTEVSRAEAISILTELLWKDMAYGVECMSLDAAKGFAENFISESESSKCKYYSNVKSAESKQWQPLTSSTFDSGVIISGNIRRHACLWFQDED